MWRADTAPGAPRGAPAALTPPALPRPPPCPWAFPTTRPPSSAAARRASSGVWATRPSGTGTPTRASSDLPWDSRRSTPLLRNVLFHPGHDVGERRARGEELGQTLLF